MSKITPLYISEIASKWYDINIETNDAKQIARMHVPVDDACESATSQMLAFESEPALFEMTLDTQDKSS